MAAPIVQAVGIGNGGVGAVTYAIPAHQAGDLLFLFVECAENTGVAAPATWAHVTNSPRFQGTNVVANNVMWLRATSGLTTDPIVVDPGNHQSGFVLVVRGGITTGDPWDFVPVADGANATAFSADGGITVKADCLVLVSVMGGVDTTTNQYSAVANASLAGFVERLQQWRTAGNGGGFGVYSGTLAAPGATGNTAGTLAALQNWASITLAVPPVAAVGGVPSDVVIGGVKKPVVVRSVIIGGIKKTVVNQSVIIGGVKKVCV